MEDIKRIEEIIKDLKEHIEFEDYEQDTLDECEKTIKALENLLKRYKELEEENEMLKKANNISEDVTVEDITQVMNKSLEEFKREFIPISVIQNKITQVIDELEKDGFVGYADELRDIVDEILEKGNK